MKRLLALLPFASPAFAGEPLCSGRGAGEIDVVTLNAWGLPAPVARDRRGRLPEIASWIGTASVDLVGLQEVWRGARSLFTVEGLLYPPARGGDSGLAMVTDHEATTPVVTEFTTARWPDSMKRKGVLQSRVQLPDGTAVWTVVTHLQAGGSDANARVRQEQIAQLVGILDDLPGPAVVMGDFNLYGDRAIDDGSRAALEAAGLVDVAEQVGAVDVTYPGGERFDRVYVRGGGGVCLAPVAAAVIRPEKALSDHHPVHARVAVFASP